MTNIKSILVFWPENGTKTSLMCFGQKSIATLPQVLVRFECLWPMELREKHRVGGACEWLSILAVLVSVYRWVPVNPNVDHPKSRINRSPVEITCRSLVWSDIFCTLIRNSPKLQGFLLGIVCSDQPGPTKCKFISKGGGGITVYSGLNWGFGSTLPQGGIIRSLVLWVPS